VEQSRQRKVDPERGRKLLDRLPREVRRRIEAAPEVLGSELEARRKAFPAKDFVPNVGQERAMVSLLAPNPVTEDYPFGTCVLGGNGTGKTALLAIVLAGIAQGPQFLSERWFGAHRFFKDFEELRKRRTTYVRIVCDGEDMTASGSVYQQVHTWIPSAKFSAKRGDYYTSIEIPPASPDHFPTVIDVKTHNQTTTAHAGPDVDVVLFNEPCPEDLFNENIGRLRRGGRWMAFLTPLHMASYLWDVINSEGPKGDVVATYIPIWDNCADIPGTRGILTKQQIERMIRMWEQTDPTTVQARVEGKFTFLAGSVFSLFNRGVHIIDPEPLDSSWNIVQVVDPHPVKPHVSVWLAFDAAGYVRVIAEYPTAPWNQISTTPLTIKHFGAEFKRIESGRHERFPFGGKMHTMYRKGDPRAFAAQNPRTRKTLQTEYEEDCGLRYNLDVETDVQLRHNAIRDVVFYNPKEPITTFNTPKLFVHSTCKNMAAALERHRYKDLAKQGRGEGMSDKVEEQWECFIAALGYGLLSREPWRAPENDRDDYREYIEGMTTYGDNGERIDEAVLCHH
jgi:hypothetical protein